MSTRQCTQEQFDKDTAEHQLIVLHDTGVYRHLRMKKPGTSCYHYDIVTYPGYLVYSGDMGCYVFSRLNDMFEFFRSDSGRINAPYWAEKLQGDGRRASQEFSPDEFRNWVKLSFRERWHGQVRNQADREVRRECWDLLNSTVLGALDDGGERACLAAYDFDFKMPRGCDMFGGRSFHLHDDMSGCNFNVYTFHFLWCCYAIVRAISAYDAWCDAAAKEPR